MSVRRVTRLGAAIGCILTAAWFSLVETNAQVVVCALGAAIVLLPTPAEEDR